ncbi:MAG TPA: hypothetical protein VHS05_06240, partial [Pyrinomonadaceae bacterium]|nr:hypothetical protein [Pyrinomonadaceae bacterium]
NHIVKRGQVELLERRMLARSKQSLHTQFYRRNKVPGTENTFLWNGILYDSGTEVGAFQDMTVSELVRGQSFVASDL